MSGVVVDQFGLIKIPKQRVCLVPSASGRSFQCTGREIQMSSWIFIIPWPIPRRGHLEGDWGGDKCAWSLSRLFFLHQRGFQSPWGCCPWYITRETSDCCLGLSGWWTEILKRIARDVPLLLGTVSEFWTESGILISFTEDAGWRTTPVTLWVKTSLGLIVEQLQKGKVHPSTVNTDHFGVSRHHKPLYC